MEKIKMMIVDDNKNFREVIEDYFKSHESISLVAECGDGVEAINVIENIKPDVVVLNMIMPHLDGIGVLEHFYKNSIEMPKFIVISSFAQDIITQNIMALGASYFMVKPFDISTLAERIKVVAFDRKMFFINNEIEFEEAATGTMGYSGRFELPYNSEFRQMSMVQDNYQDNRQDNRGNKALEIEVTKLMHDVGVPAHIKGYQYLRDSIMLVIKDQTVINSMTKVLYPYIAKTHHTTPSRVERAIRHAIEVAWNRGKVEIFNEIFGYSISFGKGKPTNGEFIAMISDRIRLRIP